MRPSIYYKISMDLAFLQRSSIIINACSYGRIGTILNLLVYSHAKIQTTQGHYFLTKYDFYVMYKGHSDNTWEWYSFWIVITSCILYAYALYLRLICPFICKYFVLKQRRQKINPDYSLPCRVNHVGVVLFKIDCYLSLFPYQLVDKELPLPFKLYNALK